MPKFIISKVSVHWSGRGIETFENVEVNTPFTPSNDNRTKEVLKAQFPGCKSIGAVYTPIKKI